MKRIGLTQRVELAADYNERRDCLDQRWSVLMTHLGYLPIPLVNAINDIDVYLSAMHLDGVILTGGNDLAELPGSMNIAPERDYFEHALLNVCISQNLPVLGVCRGMQMIASFFGGVINRVEGHSRTRHTVVLEPNAPWRQPFEVNSFHNFAVVDIHDSMEVLARAHDGTIEALHHRFYPIAGIMWHPERESQFAEQDLMFLLQQFEVQQ